MRFGSAAAITALGCASHQAWSRLTRPDAEPPQWSRLAPSVQPRRVWLAVSGGVLLVTFLSPALSSYALFGLPLGVWSALGSLGPVWAVPVLLLSKGERPSAEGLGGALLAVAGAATLSWTAGS